MTRAHESHTSEIMTLTLASTVFIFISSSSQGIPS